MSTRRKFAFPLATLTRVAGLLKVALADPDYTATMTLRLGADFATELGKKITAVTGKGTAQSGQTGAVAELTKEQQTHFDEMERLTAGARRSARLAFPGDTTRLREEFQVGIVEPKTLAAEVERAGKVHAACQRHAAALAAKGWIAADTTALSEAVAALTGTDADHEEARDDRAGLTNEKTIAANALYEATLTLQNAARLAYPAKTDAAGKAGSGCRRQWQGQLSMGWK